MTDSIEMPNGGLPLAPVGLFVYRRASILPQVINALAKCPEFEETPIYIFSDAPKNPSAEVDVAAVRAYVRSLSWSNIHLVEASANRGLARSIEAGVAKLCKDYGRAIILEDDLIVSPAILGWFNKALNRYSEENRVFQISGHTFDVSSMRRQREGFFAPMITSWGWATWDRAWDQYEAEIADLDYIANDPSERYRFDLKGRYPYFKMVQNQIAGKIDSWAIRWYLSVYKKKGLTLFPPRTLVRNVGSDVAATHRGIGGRIRDLVAFRKGPEPCKIVPDLPETVSVDQEKFDQLTRAIYWQSSKWSPIHWITR